MFPLPLIAAPFPSMEDIGTKVHSLGLSKERDCIWKYPQNRHSAPPPAVGSKSRKVYPQFLLFLPSELNRLRKETTGKTLEKETQLSFLVYERQNHQ